MIKRGFISLLKLVVTESAREFSSNAGREAGEALGKIIGKRFTPRPVRKPRAVKGA